MTDAQKFGIGYIIAGLGVGGICYLLDQPWSAVLVIGSALFQGCAFYFTKPMEVENG